MGCLFENDNKICTCAMNEERKEACSKAVKEQGYTGCVYIKPKDKTIDTESNENIAYIELRGLTINEARKICGLSEIDNPICNSILVKKEPVNKYICTKIDLEAQNKARKITNKSIKDAKKREKEIKQLIKKHPNEDIVKDLLKVNKQCMKALENIDEQERRKMKNNETKEYKIPKKDVKDMSNLEVINEQITRIISKMNGEDHLHITEVVMLSEELRELVKLRDELERIENLKKQREQFKKRQAEMIERHKVKVEEERCI